MVKPPSFPASSPFFVSSADAQRVAVEAYTRAFQRVMTWVPHPDKQLGGEPEAAAVRLLVELVRQFEAGLGALVIERGGRMPDGVRE